MKDADALKKATATLAGIVTDSGCVASSGVITQQPLTVLHGIGLDALTTLQEIYGQLNVARDSCQCSAIFGDYDEGAKVGGGKNAGDAILDLLEQYL